jgi:hypothetical protein
MKTRSWVTSDDVDDANPFAANRFGSADGARHYDRAGNHRAQIKEIRAYCLKKADSEEKALAVPLLLAIIIWTIASTASWL